MTNTDSITIPEKAKILIIQTAFLGDVILITPLLEGIRKSFPSSYITSIVRPEFLDIVKPFCDEALPLNKTDRNLLKRSVADLVEHIKAGSYDIALLPHRSIRSAKLAKDSGVPIRIGFDKSPGLFLYTHRVPYRSIEYEGKRNLKLLEVLSDTEVSQLPSLQIKNEVNDSANSLLKNLSLGVNEFAIAAPGSVWRSKQWTEDHYKTLVDTLQTKFSLPTLVIGGKEDKQLCSRIACKPEYCLAGNTSVLETAALIERSKFVISGDSAPAHITTAMGAKQIIVFGSTTPRFGFAPSIDSVRIIGLDIWCRPCSDHGRNFCPNLNSYKCMRLITPDKVIDTIKDWL